jgi:hypothetical protein
VVSVAYGNIDLYSFYRLLTTLTAKGGTVASWSTSYHKASELVSRMSLLEKVNITTGIGWSQGLCVGNTAPAVHVGFPSLCLQDGPLGLRFADHATAWPAGLTVGATWNRELMFARGAGHGEEARKKGGKDFRYNRKAKVRADRCGSEYYTRSEHGPTW